MYGMVNGAIKQHILQTYGETTWHEVKNSSNIEEDDFLSMEQYEDSVSVALVVALGEAVSKSPAQVLEDIGEYWIEFALNSEYGSLLRMAGSTLPEVLMNLDDMHVRVGQSFNKLQPPSFWCTDVTEDSLVLHYSSTREGLTPMILGLVKGLGKHLNVSCTVSQITGEEAATEYESFKVNFAEQSVQATESASRDVLQAS